MLGFVTFSLCGEVVLLPIFGSAPISHLSMGYHIFYKDIMGGVLECSLSGKGGGIAAGLGFYFAHFSVTPCYTILVLGNFSKEGEWGVL